MSAIERYHLYIWSYRIRKNKTDRVQKIVFFTIISLNVDNSINNEHKPFKWCKVVPNTCTMMEGMVSQNLYLGPRKKHSNSFTMFPDFVCIK